MKLQRSLSSLSVCVLLCLSSTLAGGGLWGQKVQFKGRACEWQLGSHVVVPALSQVSVCTRLRFGSASRWTGFVYTVPGGPELGLEGSEDRMTLWLLGRSWVLNDLRLRGWTSVCLTWSAPDRRFRVYIDESLVREESVDGSLSRPLKAAGHLILGSGLHHVHERGRVSLVELSLFRVWATELSGEELSRRRCSDGDLVRWDEEMWIHDCTPSPDRDLDCDLGSGFLPPEDEIMWDEEERLGVGPDRFFRVDALVKITGNASNPKEVVTQWLRDTLEVNETMNVLNLMVNSWTYVSSFHVQEYNVDPVVQVITSIKTALGRKYISSDFAVESQYFTVAQIMPESCPEDTLSTVYGQYIWPETFPAVNQSMGCIKPKSEKAERLCQLSIDDDRTRWAEPDMTGCRPLMDISDMENITVTPDNAEDMVGMIEGLVEDQLGDSDNLDAADLDMVVKKLEQVVGVGIMEPKLCNGIMKIIADILVSDTDVTSVSQDVLSMTENVGDTMEFPGESYSLTAPTVALSMVNTGRGGFKGLTFGVSSISSGLEPQVFLDPGVVDKPGADATISLPYELNNFFPSGEKNKTRIHFNFFGTPDLFQEQTTSNSSWRLNSNIVSARVSQADVHDLRDKVVVTFRHLASAQMQQRVKCVFWDFQTNGGRGGWSSRGCVTQSVSSNQSSCHCDHLTHFALLLDVSRTPVSESDSFALTIISNLGCGLSSIFLGVTLVTYIAFPKLRRDNPSKILINLSLALLGLSLLFLLDPWLSSFADRALCVATAASLHYFLLASFTWMGLEAVHMYLALVQVFNTYIPLYLLKLCTVGWGLPLLVVALVLVVDVAAYGGVVPQAASADLHSQDSFCWLQDDVFFYVTVVTFVLLVLLGNFAVFVLVLVRIKKSKMNKSKSSSGTSVQELRVTASLTVLLGLTWSMGFLSFGPGRVAMMYLFSIFNTLQGFFVFLFHCVMKEQVRQQWRKHLSCRGPDEELSGRSRSENRSNPVRSDLLASSKSNDTRISESTSEPEPRANKS